MAGQGATGRGGLRKESLLIGVNLIQVKKNLSSKRAQIKKVEGSERAGRKILLSPWPQISQRPWPLYACLGLSNVFLRLILWV